jgi:hypothetical protein
MPVMSFWKAMRLPDDVMAARALMEKADAALWADIESDGTDPTRRLQLIDDLQLAADIYLEKISRLRVERIPELN